MIAIALILAVALAAIECLVSDLCSAISTGQDPWSTPSTPSHGDRA